MGVKSHKIKLKIRMMLDKWTTALFASAVSLSLLSGWRLKKFELLVSERGIGYALGSIGTGLMAILFIYSLRKRMPSLGVIGSVKTWFRIHMVLGIIGPVFILFHANFRLGSLNSNVALFCLIVVAVSGLIGRYIYGRIHYGLYGRLANLRELLDNFQRQKEEIGPQFALIPGIKEELDIFFEEVFTPSKGLIESAKRLWLIRRSSFYTFGKIKRISTEYINLYAAQHQWGFLRKRRMLMQVRRKAAFFLNQAIRTAEFNFYERLFSLWHILHIPLVFILVFAVINHVVAVSRY